MSTLKEINEKLKTAKGRREIYQYLFDHLSSDFLSNGAAPKKVLQMEDKNKVEEVTVEEVVRELANAIGYLNAEISNIEGSQIVPAVPVAAQPNAAPQGESKS